MFFSLFVVDVVVSLYCPFARKRVVIVLYRAMRQRTRQNDEKDKIQFAQKQ